jgi:hypothetical protein
MSNQGSNEGKLSGIGWEATRALTSMPTQLMRDEDDYLASDRPDVGRQVGGNDRELFVSCEPALALQQQFEHLNPEFIAVHDIGTSSSRKLLASIAAASGRAVQKLFIRRQGFGTSLATLEFVELPTADGQLLRMYTTETDADTVARHGLARALLAFSRLGVVMVGELPAHSLEAAFKPLHDDMVAGPWHNRDMLLLPLSAAGTLVNFGVELGRGTGVNVRTTPQVMRPADAWGFINGTWGRLRESSPRAVPAAKVRAPGAPRFAPVPDNLPPRPSLPSLPAEQPNIAPAKTAPAASREYEATQPMPLAMRPMPEVPTSRVRPTADSVLERYVHQLSELNGVVSCCIFEIASGRHIVHAGASPGADDLATNGAELLASITATCRALGLGHALPDAAVTLGAHHLLLRPVPKHPALALHAVLDKTTANLTLARLQIQRMDPLFDEPA